MANRADTNIPELQLRAVELHELSIHNVAPGFSADNFNFEINIETNVDKNERIVIASTRVRIDTDDRKTELGKVTCVCVFSVENFEEGIKMKSDSTFELIDSFAETINSIAISTTRGLMAAELRGTILHYAFLPIIDVKSLSKSPG